MNPEQMKEELQKIASYYMATGKFLAQESFEASVDNLTTFYEHWYDGKDIKLLALQSCYTFDVEGASALQERLKTPEDFIEELKDTLSLLVECGVICKNPEGPENIYLLKHRIKTPTGTRRLLAQVNYPYWG